MTQCQADSCVSLALWARLWLHRLASTYRGGFPVRADRALGDRGTDSKMKRKDPPPIQVVLIQWSFAVPGIQEASSGNMCLFTQRMTVWPHCVPDPMLMGVASGFSAAGLPELAS